MSSGIFRGKESSNRIELSRLVQDLLNFGVLGSLWLWGWRGRVDVVGVVGGAPNTCAHACACMHIHTCTHTRGKHDNFMQMAASIGFLGNPWEFPMMSYVCTWMHVCTCTCVCMCVWGTLLPPHPIHPPPTPGGTLRITQNSIVLELIKIFQFCLKI